MTTTANQVPDGEEFRLRMTGVRKFFGATRALDGVDLAVRPGEVMALVGENGAGKSTLMKVLSGAHRRDQGDMFLEGNPYEPRDPLHAREQGIAMIYQELSLAPHLSIMENILLGIEPRRGLLLDRGTMRKIASNALREVGLPDMDPGIEVRRLSPARMQLVEIARAVALDCKVLVLDEPTSSLTGPDIQNLFALVRRLKANGISVVYISHFLEEVKEISDRFTVLRDGKTVGRGITRDTDTHEIITAMVGREVGDLYPRSQHRAGEEILTLKSLTGVEKPEGVDLRLHRGEVLGIAGLVGAGRTELMRMIFGLDPVKGGEVRVAGHPGAASPAKRWRQGVGMVSEDRKAEGLAVGLSIAENLTLPRLRGLGPWRWVRPSRQRAVCKPWIEAMPIKCTSAGQRVGALSGGNQQKVALARLLHADVDVLLLDEPTRGVDVGSKAQIYQLIDDLAKGNPGQGIPPKAVLVISSYLPELMGICDRIAVMCRGRLGAPRDVRDWDEHQLMRVATGAGDEAAADAVPFQTEENQETL
ncbi:MAG: sugar ABC transporter ATP-binding protein [Verrucomicrobia bacterium]|nr:sugar ABC transporter ATP-binding protein [Verrucomicrobiota bacterium]MCH8513662.1 sugar ABC transporter ATP-binding protein [Kiritimatiellia bacterium]